MTRHCLTGNGSLVTWTPDNDQGEEAAAASLFGNAGRVSTSEAVGQVQALPQPRLGDQTGDVRRNCVTEAIEIGEFSCQIYHPVDMNILAMIGRRGLITRLFPLLAGQSSAARYAGYGFIRAATIPQEAEGAWTVSTVTFLWEGQSADGNDKLTHTPAVAATQE